MLFVSIEFIAASLHRVVNTGLVFACDLHKAPGGCLKWQEAKFCLLPRP